VSGTSVLSDEAQNFVGTFCGERRNDESNTDVGHLIKEHRSIVNKNKAELRILLFSEYFLCFQTTIKRFVTSTGFFLK
jgi:hypothetical protein